ncbi:hypothetical protein IFM89_018833 [Coptis chinensis]|uniref:Late embryogenesis abundant protein LEA-2 subgroup domain-containing protein n=1 Tax=Coptis chinensis TaxID=261450 RepID=A0A835LE41_9MAGN|nr:hypothetical protein IFM89_018833 [Coptis chinensis]
MDTIETSNDNIESRGNLEISEPSQPTEAKSGEKKSYRGLKICCGVTLLILVIVIVVMIILVFTLFKPKQPQMIPLPVNLTQVEVEIFPTVRINATVYLVVTVKNRNYGSFKYKSTTAYVHFYEDIVAEAPIKADTMPARGERNVSAYLDIDGGKLVSSPHFWPDFNSGTLNFTSLTSMHGTVSVFKILKLHATVHNICNVTIHTVSRTVDSKCIAKFKV